MPTDGMGQHQIGPNAEKAILDELAASPLEPKVLQERVLKRVGLKGPSYKIALNAVLAARKIHGRPRLDKSGKPGKTVERYALGAPPPSARELAPEHVLLALSAAALPLTKLKEDVCRKLVGLSDKDLKAVLGDLIESRKIHARYKRNAKGLLGKTVESYALGEPQPDELIAPVLRAWQNARTEARVVHVQESALVAALLAALGLHTRDVASITPGQSDRDVVMAGLRELLMREGRGALIAMRKLRSVVPLSKDRFDAAVIELYGANTVILHHHDYVGSLSENERAELVVDRYGNHYVGVALSGEQ